MPRFEHVLTFVKSSIRFDSPLVVVFLLATVVVWWWRRPGSRGAWRLLVTYVVTLCVVSTPLGAGLLVAGLAHGLTSVETVAEARGADAIVVLGGGVQTVSARGLILAQLQTTPSLRILEAARLYRLLRPSVVIVSGGIADERTELRPEAEQMASALAGSGIPADCILTDFEAKTTHDHPRTVKPLLDAHHVHQFVIVTSPMHMRRSLGVFRAQGYDPVGSVSLLQSEQLRSRPWLLPNDDSIFLSNQALYEYAASIMYWWRGWTR
ncbi:MAG TPA: YdcF family protein [Vicinamibacterales bacterium]|nr:YdcF family protein [Vicinamibacterales bacterium]